MIDISLYQVDAFAAAPMQGNPAAVLPLDGWLDDGVMQAIAAENNLSETVFFVGGGGDFQIRWFTPKTEVELCGHGTMAAAWVIFNILEPGRGTVTFASSSGPLKVSAGDGGLLTMDFPAWRPLAATPPAGLVTAIGAPVSRVLAVDRDYLFVTGDARSVLNATPDFAVLIESDRYGAILTAPGDGFGVDFVSRFFAPRKGIPEDPVTGSAHCSLTPYWAERLGKNKLNARQLSARGGDLVCELKGGRVFISGTAALFMEGTIYLP